MVQYAAPANLFAVGNRSHPVLKLLSGSTEVSCSTKLAASRPAAPAYMKLQIDEGMWNGLDFYFYLGKINQSSLKLHLGTQDYQEFFCLRWEPFGLRPHYPNDPVDPVQLCSLK
jgi:hypothetical protein